jgi:hypothetical protein
MILFFADSVVLVPGGVAGLVVTIGGLSVSVFSAGGWVANVIRGR